MTIYDQPKTTYSDATAQARVISDVIQMIDPRDTPLLSRIGLDGARNKFNIRLNGYKIELLEDELDPLETTANNGTTIGAANTSFTVTDASVFQDGHVILIDAEYMVVKSANTQTNQIEVYSRSYDGTNATHAADAAIQIVGMARLEGDDADFGPIMDISAPYNYTSIFQKAVQVSGAEISNSQYGIEDEFLYQANKAVPHLLRLVERAAFHGVRSAGSAAAPRSMGGLGAFITDNTLDAGGAIVKAAVDLLMEEITMDGGFPDLLVMNPRVANDLRSLLDNSSFVRVTQDESKLGLKAIERVITQYGELELVMDRWCPTHTAYVLESGKVGFYLLRGFEVKELARSGDSLKGEVVGEVSLLLASDKAHGKITGITT
ncbi:MAG: DUF5309 domain-containing protein [Chloroflexi bacterium]|nr:DUF5309 domain-containing protein [Chloroflexota bacterium]